MPVYQHTLQCSVIEKCDSFWNTSQIWNSAAVIHKYARLHIKNIIQMIGKDLVSNVLQTLAYKCTIYYAVSSISFNFVLN